MNLDRLTENRHCKKSLSIFPSPAGMSYTKLSLAGNNFRLGTGKLINLLLQCKEPYIFVMLGAEAVRQLVGQGHHRVVHVSRPYKRINIQYTRLSKKTHTAWVCILKIHPSIALLIEYCVLKQVRPVAYVTGALSK
jgi:hypothetical protein